jgi:hypothetical protein
MPMDVDRISTTNVQYWCGHDLPTGCFGPGTRIMLNDGYTGAVADPHGVGRAIGRDARCGDE